MLILSQDKKRIINFDNVEVLEVVELQGDSVKIQAFFKNKIETIAEYNDNEFGKVQLQNIFYGYKGSATYALPEEPENKKNRPAPTEAVMQRKLTNL
jgi:hypothetical protein